MIEAVDCVVIGSALWRQRGVSSGDRRQAGCAVGQTCTGVADLARAAGLTSQARGTDLMTKLAKRAVRKIESFEQDTGEKLVFYQPGALKIAPTAEHVEQLRSELEREDGLIPACNRFRRPRRGR